MARRRDPFPVLDRFEIFPPVAGQHGAVEFRVSSDIVVVAGIESLAVRLVPRFLRSKMPALENRTLVPVYRKVSDMIAGLEDQDFGARRGQASRDGGAADA